MSVRQRIESCAAHHAPLGVEIIYHAGLYGQARLKERIMHTCRPRSRRSLQVFLHEAAHFALHDEVDPIPLHICEYEAHQWSFEKMRDFGIAVPLDAIKRSKHHVAWCLRCDKESGEPYIHPVVRRFARSYSFYEVMGFE